MSVNGRFKEITREDLLHVGGLFDVPKDGAQILDEVLEALEQWRPLAT